ncbi:MULTISPECIES: ketopantoate reductase family protein [unclassified Curtobacterium]|uniref:ketopantoate reductase family protein n=1 Tax=unclassified Curtobacterium TaxID=257496 RepID=UPI0021AC40C6|nr:MULTISPECIES: 2-dehydropantoate 2-reductase N-terminal domain-containing protein [unclassified Curtobacterium]
MMRILMVGRGVIATIHGQVLQEAGHHVEFLVRPGRTREYGARVRTDLVDGRRGLLGRRRRTTFATRLRESVEPGDGFDLVVLSVGHHRLREAVASLAPVVDAATVLVLGNVWDDPVAAVAPLPADQVVFGFPGAGGGFDGDGVLHGALLRSVVLGSCGTPGDRRAPEVRTTLQQAGLVVRDEPDMRGWLWSHFVMDAGMFSQALTSGGLAAMIGDRRALRGAFLTSRELLPVLAARGADIGRHRGATMPARFPGMTAASAAWATRLLPIARASLAAHTDPHAAEPRAVLEDMLATARALGIATPRLERSVEGLSPASAAR